MRLTTIEQVQKRVGKLPAPRDLKVIDHLDEHAMRWLSYASFAFISFGKAGKIQLSAAGGEPGFVTTADARHLLIPLAALDDASLASQGLSFGALFLVSGMEETLRVNGKVSSIADERVTLEVEECYLHCAKAFRRANFWVTQTADKPLSEISDFVKQSRFLVVASINSADKADVSPKGDPETLLIREEDGFLCFADRPGNRRIDSFRNIIEQPVVSIMAMVPGREEILELTGTALLCADEHLLERLSIHGKQPNLVTKIHSESARIRSCRSIARSALWPAREAPGELIPSEIFKAHMRESKESSLQAKIARAAISLPGAMEKALAYDYKNNMY